MLRRFADTITINPSSLFFVPRFGQNEGNNTRQINFDKLAEKCHYKNATTARVIYNQRRKVVLSGDAAAPPSVATGQTGAKRGRKPKDSINGDEPPKRRGRKPKDAAADGPPKKRGRPAKKVDPPPSSSPPPPSSPLKPESENEEEKETEVDDSEYE